MSERLSNTERRMRIAGAAVPAIKAEAEAEGIPITDGSAYRLAYVAVGDAVSQLEGAVDLLRECREYVDARVETHGHQHARALLARIDAALAHLGGQ